MKVTQSYPILCDPMEFSLPAEPPEKPKNTGVGSLSLLQWIFPTQELNWGLQYCRWEKATAPHSSTLAWKIPWTEEPGGLQSMGSLRVGHDWATSLSPFTFRHWRRKWQPTPVSLPGESQGRRSLVGCRLWGNISGKNDVRMKTFSDKYKLKGFSSSRYTWRQTIKSIFRQRSTNLECRFGYARRDTVQWKGS